MCGTWTLGPGMQRPRSAHEEMRPTALRSLGRSQMTAEQQMDTSCMLERLAGLWLSGRGTGSLPVGPALQVGPLESQILQIVIKLS